MIGLANQVWEVFLGEMLAPEKLVLKALKRLHEHVQDEFDVACTWRRSARFLTRCIRKTGFLQSRKEERLVKSRKTSKGNSVDVSVKKPVESTVENRLEEVVQIQKDREEGKDSLKKKMTNTCSERKQPEKVPVKAIEKGKHSGSKKSKAKKTIQTNKQLIDLREILSGPLTAYYVRTLLPWSSSRDISCWYIPVEKTCVAGSKEHPMETKEERANPEDMKTEEGMRAMEVGEYPEEKETRYSGEEGSRARWDREESSSDVSSPSTIPVEPEEPMEPVEPM